MDDVCLPRLSAQLGVGDRPNNLRRPLYLCPLESDRLPAAVALDQQCLGGLWNQDSYAREMASPNSDLLIALPDSPHLAQDAVALGCAWAIVDEAHITLLAVAPAYRRQGLGQAVLLALLKSAQGRGMERATLEVRASNQAALALYETFGFRAAGRRKKYYQDNQEDALVLWRGGLQYPQFMEELHTWNVQVGDRLTQHGWYLAQMNNNPLDRLPP
jgi:[ribosomal protein S18]-alanine N-acetyltransferase